jgi:hypothetical protein
MQNSWLNWIYRMRCFSVFCVWINKITATPLESYTSLFGFKLKNLRLLGRELDTLSYPSYTIGLSNIAYPLRLFLARTASATSRNTMNACPRMRLFFLAMISAISPNAENRMYRAYFRSAIIRRRYRVT